MADVPAEPAADAAEARPRPSARPRALHAAAAVVLALVAIELALRVEYRLRAGSWDFGAKYDPARAESIYDPHPVLRVAPRPGAVHDAVHHGVRRLARINALGFRGPEIAAEKPPGTFRIVCLGGSTTFDTFATDDAHAWPGRLEQKLRAALPGRPVEVVNAGCPGYTTHHSERNLALRAGALEPDLVVVMHAINDLRAMTMDPAAPDYGDRFPGIDDRPAPAPLPALARRSILVAKVHRKLARWRADRHEAALLAGTARADAPPEAGLAAYERNLRAIVARARALGARPMLLELPRPFRLDRPPSEARARELLTWTPHLTWRGIERGIQRCNEIVRRVAAEEDALTADPSAAVDPDEALFADWIHLNDRGSERFAGEVARAILESGVIAP